jgi:hypothetical protein
MTSVEVGQVWRMKGHPRDRFKVLDLAFGRVVYEANKTWIFSVKRARFVEAFYLPKKRRAK